MAISINSVTPVLASQEVGSIAPELLLQQGSVVSARIQQILAADMVRIAIAGLSIDVASEIPLQQGQTLQLAVSQTKDGIRLSVVGQGGDAAADAVTLSPDALADVVANRPTIVAPKNALSPLERAAVSIASQAAAGEQESLAPLFANLGSAAASGNLPPKLQQAIAQVLAQQTSLDPNLDGGDIKNAFQKSGLFLEASLAAGSLPSSGVPDLKAALIVLRQTLQSALGANVTTATPSGATPFNAAGATSAASPAGDLQVSQAQLAAAPDIAVPARNASAAAFNTGPSVALNLLQEALQEPGNPARAPAATALPREARSADAMPHTNTPPPPLRGALPAAQPIAAPSLAPDAPLATTAHHLLDDTDAALARQTLLQVASLPDRVDTPGPKADMVPRWNFEIPFVTPQGTAMAQFEISGDGEREVEAAKRIWRARFTIDVEPTGPVHALVSLTGETTSVRIWAERPDTAAQLRAGASQLSEALSRAELRPGDIVIRDGAPPQPPAAARAGHFLDRAL